MISMPRVDSSRDRARCKTARAAVNDWCARFGRYEANDPRGSDPIARTAAGGVCVQCGEEGRKNRLADTHLQLGINYMQRGQLDSAKENLDKAAELNPDSPQVNNMMA